MLQTNSGSNVANEFADVMKMYTSTDTTELVGGNISEDVDAMIEKAVDANNSKDDFEFDFDDDNDDDDDDDDDLPLVNITLYYVYYTMYTIESL
jgi:single-stranded DNA-binding protein